MKFCTYCGNEMSDGTENCPFCGARTQKTPVNAYVPNVCVAEASTKTGLSTASMVIGICCCSLVLLLCCCFYFWFLLLIPAVVGLILGCIALKKEPAGKGRAITGIITNAFGVFFSLLGLLFFIFMISSSDPYDPSRFYEYGDYLLFLIY